MERLARPRLTSSLPAFVADEGALAVGATITLGEEAAHHMRVRRLGVGERITVLDGAGGRGEGVLVRLAKSMASVDLEAVEFTEPLPEVHLLVPIADRERMLWLAEKATELGVTSWRPVLWRRSRSVSPRGEGAGFAAKVRARMLSALAQSTAPWLPAIHPDTTPERALAAAPEGTRLLLDAAGGPILGLQGSAAPLVLAIGPEGGFEDEELAMFGDAGFARVALGGYILRFETAAVAALAIARALIDASPESTNGR